MRCSELIAWLQENALEDNDPPVVLALKSTEHRSRMIVGFDERDLEVSYNIAKTGIEVRIHTEID